MGHASVTFTLDVYGHLVPTKWTRARPASTCKCGQSRDAVGDGSSDVLASPRRDLWLCEWAAWGSNPEPTD